MQPSVAETSPRRLRTSMAAAVVGAAVGDVRISAVSAPARTMPKGAPKARSPITAIFSRVSMIAVVVLMVAVFVRLGEREGNG